MPALENHTGLLRKTISEYKRKSFVNISNEKQWYSAFPAIQRNAKKAVNNKWDRFNFGLPVNVSAAGGTDMKFNVQVTKGDTFSWVDMHDPVNIDERDYEVQATVVKRQCRDHWSYNKMELAACKGAEEITNLMTTRILGRDQGFADAFENWFWDPPPASTDTRTAWPLRYYLFTEPETTVGAYTTFTSIGAGAGNTNFLGGAADLNHASYTSGPLGISRVTYQHWGNWNCQYTAFSDTDGVEKLTYALMDTNFVSPAEYPDLVKGPPERAMYTTSATHVLRARLARQQNDANTSDIVARITDNEVYRTPMYRVPQLDSADYHLYGTDPDNKDVIYGIDWSTWYWMGTGGFALQDEILEPSREAPLDYTHVRYLQGNLVCLEPRRNFVLSK